MVDVFEKIVSYMEYPFVRYAFVVGVLIALCASLMGVTLVLKRFSFIGDGLSHVAFGAMGIASVINLSGNMPFVLIVTAICAVILLKGGQNIKINADSAIAMISVGALAVGYMVLNVFSASANVSGDVCTTLFGSTSILTLKKGDVLICVVLSAAVIVLFLLLYNRIFAVTFDESFAKSAGLNVELYNLIIAVITSVIIVLAMKLVGSLLITALIIFPAVSSMRLFNSFKAVTVCAAAISVCCAAVGILISVVGGTPVGATIVIMNIIIFFVFSAADVVLRSVGR